MTTMTNLESIAALVYLDSIGAISAVHMADTVTLDTVALPATPDIDSAAQWLRVTMPSVPTVRVNVGTDPRATAALATPASAASMVRDPFRSR